MLAVMRVRDSASRLTWPPPGQLFLGTQLCQLLASVAPSRRANKIPSTKSYQATSVTWHSISLLEYET